MTYSNITAPVATIAAITPETSVLERITGVENEINQVMSVTKGTSSTIRVPLIRYNFTEICVGSENMIMRALVDTGAQVCVIRRDMWEMK